MTPKNTGHSILSQLIKNSGNFRLGFGTLDQNIIIWPKNIAMSEIFIFYLCFSLIEPEANPIRWRGNSTFQSQLKPKRHQKSNSIENLKSIQNSNSISSTDKMTLYCHIISKFKRFETQRICFIQLHIAMTLGLKLKYLKTRKLKFIAING